MLEKLLPLAEDAFRFVLEKAPILKAIDGHKRAIGDFLVYNAAGCAALAQYDPAFAYLATVSGVLGILLKVVGDVHADLKEKDE